MGAQKSTKHLVCDVCPAVMQASTCSESGSSPDRQIVTWFNAPGPLPILPQTALPPITNPKAVIAELERQVAELQARCQQSQDKAQALQQQFDCTLLSLDKVSCLPCLATSPVVALASDVFPTRLSLLACASGIHYSGLLWIGSGLCVRSMHFPIFVVVVRGLTMKPVCSSCGQT